MDGFDLKIGLHWIVFFICAILATLAFVPFGYLAILGLAVAVLIAIVIVNRKGYSVDMSINIDQDDDLL